LDGFVSRIWYPEKNILEADGNFGAMIGVSVNDRNNKAGH